MIISSRRNDVVKRAASLKQKKFRDAYGEFLVEGDKMIGDALFSGVVVSEIFATEEKIREKYQDAGGIKVTAVSDGVLSAISDEVTPQGAVAVLKKPVLSQPGILSRSLLLDRIQDPGNMGTIVRLCAAVGIRDIFTVACTDAYSPKAVRSSMSGIYSVCVRECDAAAVRRMCDDAGALMIAADMDGENVFDFAPPEKFCLCLGNEGRGLSDEVLSLCEKTISIPMKNAVESLNVGVAAGIAVYALMKGVL